MTSFTGNIEELKKMVNDCGISGEWDQSSQGDKYTFRGKCGEILNWWPKKGTLQFQGKGTETFQSKLSMGINSDSGKQVMKQNLLDSKKIFIVHGHDRDARDQLELILMRLGLQPFILQNSDGGGKTIVEALEKHIYEDSAFGIILMTPDDFGFSKNEGETEKKPRARQNVILEMGMVMATLGREKMAIIQKGTLERPSDTDGILRIEFNEHVREIAPKLAQRLQGAGFEIDSKRIAEASA